MNWKAKHRQKTLGNNMASGLVSLCLALAVASTAAWADRIEEGDRSWEGVYVREGGNMYYVLDPTDGSIHNISKGADVVWERNEDDTAREAIRTQWETARADNGNVRPRVAATSRPSADAQATGAHRETRVAQSGNSTELRARWVNLENRRVDTVPDGYVPYVRLKDVTLGDALRAVLRSVGMDYVVHEDIIYVTPAALKNSLSLEEVETRIYHLNNSGDTMPKIVLRHFPATGPTVQMQPGNTAVGGFGGMGIGGVGQMRSTGAGSVMGGLRSGGFGGGIGGGQFGGGIGGGQFGGGQFGGGQFGGGQFGGGQFGGGQFGGGGFGGGGFGGGGFGGMQDVTAITNISDMFFNIDDRMVGETPAIIGIGIQTLSPNPMLNQQNQFRTNQQDQFRN